MARPSIFSNPAPNDAQAPRPCESVRVESHNHRHWSSSAPIGPTANDALCCEARNCLQVILSGSEILLEDHLGNLLEGQKELLVKMTEHTHHLCKLLSKLLGPEEFTFSEGGGERFTALRRAPAKV